MVDTDCVTLTAQMKLEGIRRLLVLSEKLVLIMRLLRDALPGDLWISPQPDAETTVLLGTTNFTWARVPAWVSDARYGFDAAAFAALSGTLAEVAGACICKG